MMSSAASHARAHTRRHVPNHHGTRTLLTSGEPFFLRVCKIKRNENEAFVYVRFSFSWKKRLINGQKRTSRLVLLKALIQWED